MSSINNLVMEAQVLEALRTCYDPEIPVNIYELGLVYEVNVDDEGIVSIKMTLTSPHCPAVQSLPAEIFRRPISMAAFLNRTESFELMDDSNSSLTPPSPKSACGILSPARKS